MRIKICGLFREEDVEYINEAGVDYAGFVFAESRRRVSGGLAERLRGRLGAGVVPVGVFVDAAPEEIAALYRGGVIDMAQLHGAEDGGYIARLKEKSAEGGGLEPIPVIKTVMGADMGRANASAEGADYCLVDSGAGSGRAFDWGLIEPGAFSMPWFLAGGITVGNVGRAAGLNPFAVDVSSGAETDGVKDRDKILRLATAARKGKNL